MEITRFLFSFKIWCKRKVLTSLCRLSCCTIIVRKCIQDKTLALVLCWTLHQELKNTQNPDADIWLPMDSMDILSKDSIDLHRRIALRFNLFTLLPSKAWFCNKSPLDIALLITLSAHFHIPTYQMNAHWDKRKPHYYTALRPKNTKRTKKTEEL